ncbi:CD59 glycoprotein [Rhinolophus sinicus]|uniref:CD59 glycoprotein n=1 Tax=Rhinolophus sinicus TaxID=89399 RepID=UPI003D78C61D
MKINEDWPGERRLSQDEMQGSKGRFVLLILSVLCHSGHGLKCHNCLNPTGSCTGISSGSDNFDECLSIKIQTETYYQCWRRLCVTINDGTSVSGKTHLLVTLLLAAAWNLSL